VQARGLRARERHPRWAPRAPRLALRGAAPLASLRRDCCAAKLRGWRSAPRVVTAL